MAGKVFTIVIVLLILALVGFSVKEFVMTGEFKPMNMLNELRGYFKKRIGSKGTEIYRQPVIYMKQGKNGKWVSYKMTKEKFTVGRGECDISVEEPYFSKKQFEIVKEKADNEEYFILTSYGKVTRTEYLESKEEGYVYLNYKDQIVLEERNVFYVGDVKFRIDAPEVRRRVGTATQRDEDIEIDKNDYQKTRNIHRESSDRDPSDMNN